jgi:tripartite ATP-independent transporter DctM subunit
VTLAISLTITLVVLVGLLFGGAPVFVAFLVVNIAGVFYFFGPSGFGLFANSIFTTANTDTLAAVPLFIVMGEVLFRSGTMELLFSSLDRLIGRVRGRQYILCVLLSAILGALSGAAMAVAGLLGRSLYPAMIKRGYNARLSAGTILGGASLDPIIPPSVLAVILATIAQVSTGKLLIAGAGPGILLTGMFLIYVTMRVWLDPTLAPDISSDERAAGGSVLTAVLQMLPSCFIFFLVMGLVMLGVATPTEAAATGVFGAVVLAFFYGGLSFSMLRELASGRHDFHHAGPSVLLAHFSLP